MEKHLHSKLKIKNSKLTEGYPSNPTNPFGGEPSQVPDMDAARAVILPLCYENAVSFGYTLS